MSEQTDTERVMYNGRIYSRKCEAIWAAYFESLGIKADYLPALPSLIPTFYLPDMKTNVVIGDKSQDTDGSYTEDLHGHLTAISQPDHGSFGHPEADSSVMILDLPWKEDAAVPYCTRVNSEKEIQTSIYDKYRGFFLVIDEVPAFVVEHCSKKDHFNGNFLAAQEAVLMIDEKERGSWEEAITYSKMSQLDFVPVFSESDPDNLSGTKKMPAIIDDAEPDFEKTAIEEVLEYQKEITAESNHDASDSVSENNSERRIFGNGEENLQELSRITPAFEEPEVIPENATETQSEINNTSESNSSEKDTISDTDDFEDISALTPETGEEREEKEPEPFVPTQDLENLFSDESQETEFEFEPAENTFEEPEQKMEEDLQNLPSPVPDEEAALKNWIKMCLKPRKWINKNRSVSEINEFFRKMTGAVVSDETLVTALRSAGYESKEDKNGRTWFKIKDHSIGFTAMIPRSYSPSLSDWIDEEKVKNILKKF